MILTPEEHLHDRGDLVVQLGVKFRHADLHVIDTQLLDKVGPVVRLREKERPHLVIVYE